MRCLRRLAQRSFLAVTLGGPLVAGCGEAGIDVGLNGPALLAPPEVQLEVAPLAAAPPRDRDAEAVLETADTPAWPVSVDPAPPPPPRLLSEEVRAAAYDIERQLDALAAEMEQPQAGSVPSDAAPVEAPAEEYLPWATERLSGPEALAALGQAQELVRRASELAARGAQFAARADFVWALGLVAEALDRARGTSQHSRALVSGLRALEEADDFAVPPGGRALPLATIVAAHDTPGLWGGDASAASPAEAHQLYCTFAAEQLAAAAGREPVGSLALYGLGKLQTGLAPGGSPAADLALPKAAALYQAALWADEQNFLAANELAMAHVQRGRLAEARELLARAAPAAGRPELWQNLAMVCQRAGDPRVAQAAAVQARLVAARGPFSPTALSAAGVPIRVVDAQTFAQSSLAFDPIVAAPRPTAAVPSATPQRAADRKAGGFAWPWSARK
jgi:tetratricopeptide (TPR) repeat protein